MFMSRANRCGIKDVKSRRFVPLHTAVNGSVQKKERKEKETRTKTLTMRELTVDKKKKRKKRTLEYEIKRSKKANRILAHVWLDPILLRPRGHVNFLAEKLNAPFTPKSRGSQVMIDIGGYSRYCVSGYYPRTAPSNVPSFVRSMTSPSFTANIFELSSHSSARLLRDMMIIQDMDR